MRPVTYPTIPWSSGKKKRNFVTILKPFVGDYAHHKLGIEREKKKKPGKCGAFALLQLKTYHHNRKWVAEKRATKKLESQTKKNLMRTGKENHDNQSQKEGERKITMVGERAPDIPCVF